MTALRSVPKYRPELATRVERAPSGAGWLHELAYDGYRAGCFIRRGEVTLASKDGSDCTAPFPEIVAAAKRLEVDTALLDGQIAVVLADGTTSREALDDALSGGAREGLTYFVFDLLHLDGENTAELPLEARKAQCERLLAPLAGRVIRYSAHFAADGATVFARACELGARGIVSKRRDCAYRPGRSMDWLATRCAKRRAQPKPKPKGQHELQASRAPVVAGVTITTPERPVYPALGLTKLDLARYYALVAEHMLRYVSNRPLTLVRCEKGVRSADALRADCKFLRHEPGWHRWAREPVARLQIQEQKKVGEYLIVTSPEGLVSLAQGDILEVHVWNSTATKLEKPDRVVFDLDPGSGVAWSAVIDAARLLRDELERVELESWVKLTGGKGLHVVVPFRPERGWDEVFAFARSAAEALARTYPAAFTLEYGKRGRESKILLDYKRNHRAAVAVAAYSARARASAGVSAPVSWRELTPVLSSDAFTLTNLAARLKALRADPWRDFWRATQRLPRAGEAVFRR